MKKMRIAILVIVGMLVGGGATFAAANNYYAQMVLDQKEYFESQLDDYYDARMEAVGKQVHNDMIMYVSTQSDAMMERTKVYMNRELDKVQQQRMNAHSQKIDKAVKDVEQELIKYVDNLVKEGEK